MENKGICKSCGGKMNKHNVCLKCGEDSFFRKFTIIYTVFYTIGLIELFAFISCEVIEKAVFIVLFFPLHYLYIYFYFRPLRLARCNSNKPLIVGILNYLLGWTIIGWFFLYLYARRNNKDSIINKNQKSIDLKLSEIKKLEDLMEHAKDNDVRESFKADIIQRKKELEVLKLECEEYSDLYNLPYEEAEQDDWNEQDVLNMLLKELEERITALYENGNYSEEASHRILSEYSEEVQQMYLEKISI